MNDLFSYDISTDMLMRSTLVVLDGKLTLYLGMGAPTTIYKDQLTEISSK